MFLVSMVSPSELGGLAAIRTGGLELRWLMLVTTTAESKHCIVAGAYRLFGLHWQPLARPLFLAIVHWLVLGLHVTLLVFGTAWLGELSVSGLQSMFRMVLCGALINLLDMAGAKVLNTNLLYCGGLHGAVETSGGAWQNSYGAVMDALICVQPA